MMIGIVGAGADKFMPQGEALAKKYIQALIADKKAFSPLIDGKPLTVASGHSIMGGIDIWAEEEAKRQGVYDPKFIFHPKTFDGRLEDETHRSSWNAPYGYKARNLDIAKSDEVHVIVVDAYPCDYTGKMFGTCYHCHTSDHVKSGGCWTGLHAKKAMWLIIHNDGSGWHPKSQVST